jgi:hypothetical protein
MIGIRDFFAMVRFRYSSSPSRAGGELPPVAIQIAEDEAGIAAGSLQVPDVRDAESSALGGKFAVNLLDLGGGAHL